MWSCSYSIRALLICCDILLKCKIGKGRCLSASRSLLKVKVQQTHKWKCVCGLFCISNYLLLRLSDDIAISWGWVRYNRSSSRKKDWIEMEIGKAKCSSALSWGWTGCINHWGTMLQVAWSTGFQCGEMISHAKKDKFFPLSLERVVTSSKTTD